MVPVALLFTLPSLVMTPASLNIELEGFAGYSATGIVVKWIEIVINCSTVELLLNDLEDTSV